MLKVPVKMRGIKILQVETSVFKVCSEPAYLFAAKGDRVRSQSLCFPLFRDERLNTIFVGPWRRDGNCGQHSRFAEKTLGD